MVGSQRFLRIRDEFERVAQSSETDAMTLSKHFEEAVEMAAKSIAQRRLRRQGRDPHAAMILPTMREWEEGAQSVLDHYKQMT